MRRLVLRGLGAAHESARGAQGRSVKADDRELGAASAELAGIIFVISLMVAAVVTAAGSGALGSAYENLFCRAFSWFGTSCEASAETSTQDREPEQACVVQTDSQTRSLGITAVIDLEGGGTIVQEKMSDDTYRVTYEGIVKGGTGVGVGGHLTVEVDDNTYGLALDASLGADGAISGGSSWEFDSEGEASELVSELERQLSNATTPLVGPIRDAWHWGFGDKYEMPAPTETFGEVGLYGDASASATALVDSASAEGNAAHMLGAKQNHDTGEATVYYSFSADVSAAAQSFDAANLDMDSASAHGETQMTIALTYDPSGEYLTDLSVEGMAYGDVNYDLAGLFQSTPEDNSKGRVYNASLSLTDEETALIAYDLARSAGIDLPPSQLVDFPVTGPVDAPAVSATERFVDAARERGEVYRQDFTGDDNTGFAVSGGGKVLGEFGGSYANTSLSRTMTDAQYFDGTQWADWVSCYP